MYKNVTFNFGNKVDMEILNANLIYTKKICTTHFPENIEYFFKCSLCLYYVYHVKFCLTGLLVSKHDGKLTWRVNIFFDARKKIYACIAWDALIVSKVYIQKYILCFRQMDGEMCLYVCLHNIFTSKPRTHFLSLYWWLIFLLYDD